ncbi:hypothetical protein CP_0502 [Chlamydia pneumoniae AR39]|uniref:Uncharacterized protein n=1 Tax=Chlamydia pneumoniae TaxID=83558 RepID=Q9K259_CHLPN|nr:hypothetical protein CP_0502 [Chlamydia pneumoniae AR39]
MKCIPNSYKFYIRSLRIQDIEEKEVGVAGFEPTYP